MKKIIGLSVSILGVLFIIYLLLPSPDFPEPPIDSVQSMEPADTETPLRRAYFTNYTREEVHEHYRGQFVISFMGIEIPTYTLIYPPEEAYGIIRDQTRSTHLKEIVYPMRESFYINEFVPKEEKDDIWYDGVHYNQKITVRIVQSSPLVRSALALGVFVILFVVVVEWLDAFGDLWKALKKLKWPFFWM